MGRSLIASGPLAAAPAISRAGCTSDKTLSRDRRRVIDKLLLRIWKLRWAFAFVIIVLAAGLFRSGLQEVAVIVWFLALILVLPMWSQSK